MFVCQMVISLWGMPVTSMAGLPGGMSQPAPGIGAPGQNGSRIHEPWNNPRFQEAFVTSNNSPWITLDPIVFYVKYYLISYLIRYARNASDKYARRVTWRHGSACTRYGSTRTGWLQPAATTTWNVLHGPKHATAGMMQYFFLIIEYWYFGGY